MTRLTLVLCCVAVLASVFAGWVGSPLDVMSQATRSPAAPHIPQIQRPGQTLLASANALLAEHPPPPPPKPPKPPPKPAPPPPPDVSVVLAGQVSAVVADRSGNLSLVLQSPMPERHVQILRVGDAFIDGWRLSELTRRSAVLTRHGEIRRVAFY